MKKMQSGFTLVELIVVIVILGILAATAAPRFMNVSSDARIAALDGVEAAMRSANSMIYARAALTAGALGAGPTDVTFTNPGATVSVVRGFAATAAQLRLIMDLSNDFDAATNTAQIRMANAPNPATCMVAYTAATATDAPTYVPTTTGC